ncbi:anti-sigma factor antagonist [Longimycelium tulufanense]|uniref:Anti-sigma factor antagonist n=1 Tax=Longimycelium tulufanense TaxID=907463 RepID=A0A8J3CBS9_9PSEU|nr:STAS domain-containing protein [Longimycelium tulufanense]GGM45752.1 anti-sigma factor antagonist [Longimycelium tulufanense]
MGEDTNRTTPGVAHGRVTGTEAMIVLRGEVDLGSAPQLDNEVARAFDAGARRIVVDFAAVTFFDSACLSALVRAKEAAQARGGDVVLRNVDRYARRILDITGLSEMFVVDGGQPAK